MSRAVEDYFAEFGWEVQNVLEDWRQLATFDLLAAEKGWTPEERNNEYGRLTEAHIRVIMEEFSGSTAQDYQKLCEDVGIRVIPGASKRVCSTELGKEENTVNIVDFVQFRKRKREGITEPPVRRFESTEALKEYTKNSGKSCPYIANRPELLRQLLREF
jgi:hypothetical protein